MVGFLQAAGAFGGGAAQGMGQAQMLRQRAMVIQQVQQQIDQAKKDLAAKAMIFSNLGQQQGGQQGGGAMMNTMPQPPMPGQSSMPQQGRPQMPPQGPQGAPQMGMPQGQPQMPQQPQAPAGGPQGGSQPGSSLDPYSVLMRIARGIKQRNPGIDNSTLASAVSQTVNMMKGVQPDIRAQLQYMATQLHDETMRDVAAGHDQTSRDNTTARDNTSTANTTARDNTSMANTTARDATSSGNTQARIQGDMQRAQFIQQSIDKRVASGQTDKATAAAQRAAVTDLQTQLRVLSARYNATFASQPAGTDPSTIPALKTIQTQVDAVTRKMGAAEKRYDATTPAISSKAVNSVLKGGDAPGSVAAAQGGLPDGLPDPSKYPEGSQVKDGQGKVVAVKKGGTWVSP